MPTPEEMFAEWWNENASISPGFNRSAKNQTGSAYLAGLAAGQRVCEARVRELEVELEADGEQIRHLRMDVIGRDVTIKELTAWRPMADSPPRDGTRILMVEHSGRVIIACYLGGCFVDSGGSHYDSELRGWLPLPAPMEDAK